MRNDSPINGLAALDWVGLRWVGHGTMVPWYDGTMVPWYPGDMVPWYHGTMVQWYHGTNRKVAWLEPWAKMATDSGYGQIEPSVCSAALG